jgi:hypothetical protein
MIHACYICGYDAATAAPVVIASAPQAGHRMHALCYRCDLRLRRAAELDPEQVEDARDEAQLQLAVLTVLIERPPLLVGVLDHYRTLAVARKISAAKREPGARA